MGWTPNQGVQQIKDFINGLVLGKILTGTHGFYHQI
jgi:hypothetical protein